MIAQTYQTTLVNANTVVMEYLIGMKLAMMGMSTVVTAIVVEIKKTGSVEIT